MPEQAGTLAQMGLSPGYPNFEKPAQSWQTLCERVYSPRLHKMGDLGFLPST